MIVGAEQLAVARLTAGRVHSPSAQGVRRAGRAGPLTREYTSAKSVPPPAVSCECGDSREAYEIPATDGHGNPLCANCGHTLDCCDGRCESPNDMTHVCLACPKDAV